MTNRGGFWTRLISWGMVPLLVALDQGSKAAIAADYFIGESVEILGDAVRLTYVRNSGAAFGLGAAWPGVFKGLTGVAICALAAYKFFARDRSAALHYPLGLILAGAIGNMIDRLRFNSVIDFVDVGLGDTRWPAFNVADSCISSGVVLLILLPWLLSRPDTAAPLPAAESPSCTR